MGCSHFAVGGGGEREDVRGASVDGDANAGDGDGGGVGP